MLRHSHEEGLCVLGQVTLQVRQQILLDVRRETWRRQAEEVESTCALGKAAPRILGEKPGTSPGNDCFLHSAPVHIIRWFVIATAVPIQLA